MAAEKQFTLSASGVTDVVIWATKVDHNFDKPFYEFNRPRQDISEPPDTLIVDIGTLKEIITVQGWLDDEPTSAAEEKKNNLLNMIKNKRIVTATWGGGVDGSGSGRKQTLSGNIKKIGFQEVMGIVGGTQKSGYEKEKNYFVNLSITVGTDSRS